MNIAATIQILNFLNLDRKAFCFYLFEKNRQFFATNLNVLIPISLQTGGVNLCYFKFRLFDLKVVRTQSLKYLRSMI